MMAVGAGGAPAPPDSARRAQTPTGAQPSVLDLGESSKSCSPLRASSRNSGVRTADVISIKEGVRQTRVKPVAYDVTSLYHETGFFQFVARHGVFEKVTLGVIVINAVWIWVDTDHNGADTLLDAEAVFIAADVLFFCYFVVELFVRYMAFRRKLKCLKDAWFVFDATLVTLYAFDPFILAIIAAAQGGGSLNLPTAVLRLFRLARLTRLVRMLRSFPMLMVLIKGIITATASVAYSLFLLALITYVFAIALRNLVGKEDEIKDVFFSSVPESMHHLILFGTFADELSSFIIPIKDQNIPCWILTWIFIAMSNLTVLNMLIGVMCSVITQVAADEQEDMMVERIREQFGEIVAELDTNTDGLLSWSEFQLMLEKPQALAACESVSIDPETMIDLCEDLFFEDGEPVGVSFEDFMQMVLDCRGGQEASVREVMSIAKICNNKFSEIRGKVERVECNAATVDSKLDGILGTLN